MKLATKHCAIYTRKSTEERLDMEFNTLDAQREACLAYITSQKSESWQPVKSHYDDGGFSGGNMDRPALNQLLDDIRAGKVHIIVVYKIDRLTRSLMDFAKLVEVFDKYGVTFVSITQSFNTTTSMGRLTLNVLLSFAQFEREVTGERIRDKIAASKARGMWVGGKPPVGYKIVSRQLETEPKEAKTTRHIFARYLALGSVKELKKDLEHNDIKSPARVSQKGRSYGGVNFSRGALYAILKNPAYIGKISHKGTIYNGLHEGIIPIETWEETQAYLEEQTVKRTATAVERNILKGLLFDCEGTPYSPTFTKKNGKQYRYYLSQNLLQYRDHPKGVIVRIPAHEIETAIEKTLRYQLSSHSKLSKLLSIDPEADHNTLKHIADNQSSIRTEALIKKSIKRAIIEVDTLKLEIETAALCTLIEKELRLSVPAKLKKKTTLLSVSYKTRRAKRGALIIETDITDEDPFDLPPHKLRNLIQGTIWRNDHFSGMTLGQIADREKFSKQYIRQNILKSLQVR